MTTLTLNMRNDRVGWMRRTLWICLLVLGGAGVMQGALTNKWEHEVREHEARDQAKAPVRGGVLFVGSSSIRLWKTLEEDFAGTPVMGRGIGGCQMEDVNFYLERLVLPYAPRQIFVYAGDNDLASGKTPKQVLEDFKEFCARVHSRLPDTRIGFLSVKPSRARWKLVDKIKETNEAVKTFVKGDRRLEYVDLFAAMTPDGSEPDAKWFESDGLHMNREGYRLWATVVRRHL